jgi:hypothetical protein
MNSSIPLPRSDDGVWRVWADSQMDCWYDELEEEENDDEEDDAAPARRTVYGGLRSREFVPTT